MEIEWNIELDDGDDECLGAISIKDDDDKCLGTILIRDDNGNEISEELTYIDSWLFGLGESIFRFQRQETNFKVDLIEEPDYLIVVQSAEGLNLSYKENALHIKTFTEYKTCVVNAIKKFIDACSSSKEYGSLMIEELENILTKFNGASDARDH